MKKAKRCVVLEPALKQAIRMLSELEGSEVRRMRGPPTPTRVQLDGCGGRSTASR